MNHRRLICMNGQDIATGNVFCDRISVSVSSREESYTPMDDNILSTELNCRRKRIYRMRTIKQVLCIRTIDGWAVLVVLDHCAAPGALLADSWNRNELLLWWWYDGTVKQEEFEGR